MPVRPLENETPEYRKQRAELLEAELALRDQIERVAALRRALPATPLDDPCFEEIRDGVRTPVRLSELFDAPHVRHSVTQEAAGDRSRLRRQESGYAPPPAPVSAGPGSRADE
jgi:Bacterial protein of unknown function (DUF899)